MVPHLDTVCAINDLELQHRLAQASRAHRLMPSASTLRSRSRQPAGVWTAATLVHGLKRLISLRPAVATGLSS
jgi:hypothetical protein